MTQQQILKQLMEKCHAHRNNKGHIWKADNLNAFGG
jgi:hypothetical protein